MKPFLKKQFKAIILFLSIAIMLSGCTPMMMYIYGVRNPKIETEKSIRRFAKNNGLTQENLYVFRDTVALRKFYKLKIGTPEIQFYNREGKLMHYRDDKKCNAQNDSLISFLNPENVSRLDPDQTIYSFLDDIRTPDNKPVDKKDFEGYDYYLVMYWAKYAGMTTRTHLPDWEKQVQMKKNLKIKIIEVTADYMDFWHPNPKTMIKLYSGQMKAEHNGGIRKTI